MTPEPSLSMLVPTKGRPGNAARLLKAVNETAADDLFELIFAIDHDEPLAAEYAAAVPDDAPWNGWEWAKIARVKTDPQRIGPILNHLAVDIAAGKATHIGFMGDDHLPVTDNWDRELIASLGGKPGVAYGNDLVQGEKLPTAVVISAGIIQSLGYLVPPGLEHLYFDDFWKMLGASLGNLVYREDVVIQHLHPTVGKAEWDEGYQLANSPEQFQKDRAAYTRYIGTRWHDDLRKLRKDLARG